MFHFANPEYLYGLIVLPLLVLLYIYTSFQRVNKELRWGSRRMLKSLVPGISTWRPLTKFTLLLSALALCFVMLARPQLGALQITKEKSGIEVAFMLDISNSMLAEDVHPNRLERVKLLVSTMIDRMQTDKVSLGVFAGEAYPQLPITSDYASAKVFLNTIFTDMVTSQGTNIGAAIRLADKSFTDAKNVGKAIILITDGEDHEGGAVEAAQEAAKEGRQVFVLGVGSTEGTQIPTSEGPLQDENGQPVITRLNEDMCKELAKAGSGQYFHIDNTSNAQTQLQHELDQMQHAPLKDTETAYNEQFQAVGLIVLFLLIVEFFMFETQNPWIDRLHIFRKK